MMNHSNWILRRFLDVIGLAFVEEKIAEMVSDPTPASTSTTLLLFLFIKLSNYEKSFPFFLVMFE